VILACRNVLASETGKKRADRGGGNGRRPDDNRVGPKEGG
jgi:hypothetical protein